MGNIANSIIIRLVEPLRGRVDTICARIRSAQRHDSAAKIGEEKTCMYMVDNPKVDMRVKVHA